MIKLVVQVEPEQIAHLIRGLPVSVVDEGALRHLSLDNIRKYLDDAVTEAVDSGFDVSGVVADAVDEAVDGLRNQLDDAIYDGVADGVPDAIELCLRDQGFRHGLMEALSDDVEQAVADAVDDAVDRRVKRIVAALSPDSVAVEEYRRVCRELDAARSQRDEASARAEAAEGIIPRPV